MRDHSHRRRLSDALWGGIRTSRPEDDCFADEIAIDFPSVAAAVERIRESFLRGESSVTELSTEVRLSMQDASDGITIPLDVPLHGTCPLCGGRGGTWLEACRPCGGSGASLLHHRVRVSLPAGVTDGARFHFSVSSPHARPTRIEVRVAVTS